MTQDVTTSIDATTTSGTQLAALLEEAFASFITSHSGTSRPSYAEAGTVWMDESDSDQLKIYQGGSDTSLIDYIGGSLIARVDALELASEARKIPVGHIVTTNSDATPAVAYGYGTWSLVAQDRVIVGGQSGDTAGATFGSDSVNISEAQLPSHAHGPGSLSGDTSTDGAHTHDIEKGGTGGGDGVQNGPISGTYLQTESAGNHSHTVSLSGGATGTTGSGDSLDVRQASVTYFYWQRTA